MAFETWQSNAAQMANEARKLKHALMRMIHAKMAAAFGTWRHVAMYEKARYEKKRLLKLRQEQEERELWESVRDLVKRYGDHSSVTKIVEEKPK